MFKTLMGINRREDLTFDQFIGHWVEIHAPLIRALAGDLGIVKYVQLHRADNPGNTNSEPSPSGRFDGIAEVWYESENHFRALGKSESGRAAVAKVIEDQKRFIGSETLLFKGYESEVISG